MTAHLFSSLFPLWVASTWGSFLNFFFELFWGKNIIHYEIFFFSFCVLRNKLVLVLGCHVIHYNWYSEPRKGHWYSHEFSSHLRIWSFPDISLILGIITIVFKVKLEKGQNWTMCASPPSQVGKGQMMAVSPSHLSAWALPFPTEVALTQQCCIPRQVGTSGECIACCSP